MKTTTYYIEKLDNGQELSLPEVYEIKTGSLAGAMQETKAFLSTVGDGGYLKLFASDPSNVASRPVLVWNK